MTCGRCGMLALAVVFVAGLGARPASGQTTPPSDVAKRFIGMGAGRVMGGGGSH